MKLSYQNLKSNTNQYKINDFWVVEKSFGVHWHYHPEIEICYVKQGFGHRIIGNSVQRFQQGDLVLVGSNLPHCWITDKAFNKSDLNIEVFVIQFSRAIFSKRIEAFNTINRLFDESERGIFFDCRKFLELKHQLINISKKSETLKFVNLLSLLNLMSTTQCKAVLSSSDYNIERSDKTEYRITKVCKYIQEHYKQPITLSELAEIASMNASSFSRFFKKI